MRRIVVKRTADDNVMLADLEQLRHLDLLTFYTVEVEPDGVYVTSARESVTGRLDGVFNSLAGVREFIINLPRPT